AGARVSCELPMEVRAGRVRRPSHVGIGPIVPQGPEPRLLDALAELVANARRPMLWLGGGAREAGAAALALVERGFAAVSSTNGPAGVAGMHPRTLRAHNTTPPAQARYHPAPLMIRVGPR